MATSVMDGWHGDGLSEMLQSAIAPHPQQVAPHESVQQVITRLLPTSYACTFAPTLSDRLSNGIVFDRIASDGIVSGGKWAGGSDASSGTSDWVQQGGGSCVLVTEGDRLLGIVTETDIVRWVAAGQPHPQEAIATLMSSPVTTLNIAEFTDIFVALHLFQRLPIRHLPVVDDRGQVIGLMTHHSFQILLQSIEFLQNISATEVLTAAVCVDASQSLLEAAQIITQHQVSSLIVVQPAPSPESIHQHPIQRPIGRLTERHIAEAIALQLDVATTRVQEVMDKAVPTVEADTSLLQIQQQLYHQHLDQVMVINPEGELIGAVTQPNILNLLHPLKIYTRMNALMQERERWAQEQLRQQQLLARVADQIRASLDLSEVLETAVVEVRKLLGCDRLLLCQFQPNDRGTIVAESVQLNWRTCTDNCLDAICFPGEWANRYQQGIVAIDDVNAAQYSDDELKILQSCCVRASVVVPILVSDQFWGLLIGHQCSGARHWTESELFLFEQIALQLAIAIQQATIHQQFQTELLERRRMEAALRTSEERYRQIVETTLEGIWIIDADNCTSYVNPCMANMLGYSMDEMLGHTLFDFMDKEAKQQAQINLERRRQGIREQHDFCFKTKSGGDLWTLIVTNPLYDHEGSYAGALAVITDVSDRRRAEAETLQFAKLRTELTILEEILDHVLGGYWDADLINHTQYISPGFKQMFGYEDDELPNSPDTWKTLVFPEDLEKAFCAYQAHVESRGTIPYQAELRYRHKNGSTVWVICTGQVITWDEHGVPLRLIGCHVDITERKLAEEENKRLRDRLEFLMSTSPAVIFTSEAVGDYAATFVSENVLSVTGYTSTEFLSESTFWIDRIHPEDLGIVFANLSRLFDQGSHAHEYRFLHKNGTYRWLREELRLVRDSQGHPIEMVGYFADISDRKQAELRLQQQANREHLISGIVQRIRASLNLGEILNTTVAEVQQVLKTDRVLTYRLLPDGQGEVIAEAVAPSYPALQNMIFSSEIFPPEAYPPYLNERVFALNDREEGTILPCLADFLRDINVRAELAVPIVENSCLWGLLIVHQCVDPRQWQTWEIDLLHQLSSQLGIAIQQSQLYAQLQESHHQLTFINAELMRATRLKDEFLANMSHELRTPLNAILGMSEGLQDEVIGTLNAKQKKAIATIERSGEHLLGLINDILELSKIEAGRLELNLSLVAIAPLCKASLSFVKQQSFKKQIQLQTSIPSDLEDVLLDERRIRQVLINLLNNAVKFTPSGGKVSLDVYYEPIDVNLAERVPTTRPLSSSTSMGDYRRRNINNYYLCFSVIDTGIGIDEVDQRKLFHPFVQVDSSLNRQYEGTGLGLVLVKRIVELHGGDVSLTSHLGEGSCFTVRLPCRTTVEESLEAPTPENILSPSEAQGAAVEGENDQPIAPQPSQASEGDGPCILLAEDNEANVNTICHYLGAKGYRILVAQDGEEAIALAKDKHPALILMDIQMPKVDGLQAIRQIRQDADLVDLPIIALTALAMEGDRQRCLDAGANDYMTKPVKLRDLTSKIQSFLTATQKES